MKALKHAFPANYSTDIFVSSFTKEIKFFPFCIFTPYFTDKETKIHLQGYVALQWEDPKIRKWNSSLPEWQNLTQFPLINFENYPYDYPIIAGTSTKVSFINYQTEFSNR